MKDVVCNIFFKCCRFLVRCFTPRYRICYPQKTATPAVYIVHHQNLQGPITSMVWFPLPLRLWVLSVFCRQKTCFRQFYNYTFTKRFGLPKLLACVLAYPLSFGVAGLMRGMQAIPVFRGSREIIKTFRESINVLLSGQNLLIAPDVDYTNTDSHIGEIYTGFLDLEKFYFKHTRKHLAFVPLYIDHKERCFYVGEPLYFQTKDNFRQEKRAVYTRLMQEFRQLEKQISCQK